MSSIRLLEIKTRYNELFSTISQQNLRKWQFPTGRLILHEEASHSCQIQNTRTDTISTIVRSVIHAVAQTHRDS